MSSAICNLWKDRWCRLPLIYLNKTVEKQVQPLQQFECKSVKSFTVFLAKVSMWVEKQSHTLLNMLRY